DTAPPALRLAVDQSVLWPPNHRMVPVQVGWQVSDSCDPAVAVVLVSVASSEPDDASGDGDGRTTGEGADACGGAAAGGVRARDGRDAASWGRCGCWRGGGRGRATAKARRA